MAIVRDTARTSAPAARRSYECGEGVRYEGAEDRTQAVKANYCGSAGVEGVWVRVTPAAHDAVMDDSSTGEAMRATLENDTFDGFLKLGTEVVIETRGRVRPVILGWVTPAALEEIAGEKGADDGQD